MDCAEPGAFAAPADPVIDTWVGISDAPLPLSGAAAWVVRPDCGAVVTFSGTARDHSDGRTGVTLLHYEAYEPYASAALADVAAEARRRWPGIGRLAALHRIGPVPVTQSAVVVAVSSAHRDIAFEAARFTIDTVKATVPLWKKECGTGGAGWARPVAAARPAASGTGSVRETVGSALR